MCVTRFASTPLFIAPQIFADAAQPSVAIIPGNTVNEEPRVTMKISAPIVSVLMATHDGLEYLPESVGSILNQTFRDFEFIIIDDGSSDGSGEWLEERASCDSRIQLIRQDNAGLTVSLNRGLHLARGEFIARMDADDIALRDRFELQLRFMDSHPEIVCVGGQTLLIDPSGRPLRHFPHPLTHEEIDGAHCSGTSMARITHPAAFIRREAVSRVNGYREEFRTAQDLDLFLRLAEIGRLANLPATVLQYRQHEGSVGYSMRQRQVQTAWRAARDAADRRGLPFDVQPPDLSDTSSSSKMYAKWAWWALQAGNVSTARHHALRAWLANPFSVNNWRLAFCALRGR